MLGRPTGAATSAPQSLFAPGVPLKAAAYYGEAHSLLDIHGDVKTASFEIRRGFVRKVLGLFSSQLMLTCIISAQIFTGGEGSDWLRSHEWILLLSVGLNVAMLGAMLCCGTRLKRSPDNLICLLLFTLVQGTMIGFVSAIFTWQSLMLSAFIALFVVMSLTSYAFSAKTDFTGIAPYVITAALVVVYFGLALVVLPMLDLQVDYLVAIYDLAGVAIFLAYVIFDLQLMLGEWGGHPTTFTIDNYAFATVSIYADMVNLFVHLLSMLAERD